MGTPAYLAKALCALIPEEQICLLGELSDDNVQFSVVIDVAKINAHRSFLLPIPAQRRPREQSHFLEGAVMLIVIEIVRSGIVGDIEVRPAIIVIVRPHPLDRKSTRLNSSH